MHIYHMKPRKCCKINIKWKYHLDATFWTIIHWDKKENKWLGTSRTKVQKLIISNFSEKQNVLM